MDEPTSLYLDVCLIFVVFLLYYGVGTSLVLGFECLFDISPDPYDQAGRVILYTTIWPLALVGLLCVCLVLGVWLLFKSIVSVVLDLLFIRDER